MLTTPIAVCLYRIDPPDDEQQAYSKNVGLIIEIN